MTKKKTKSIIFLLIILILSACIDQSSVSTAAAIPETIKFEGEYAENINGDTQVYATPSAESGVIQITITLPQTLTSTEECSDQDLEDGVCGELVNTQTPTPTENHIENPNAGIDIDVTQSTGNDEGVCGDKPCPTIEPDDGPCGSEVCPTVDPNEGPCGSGPCPTVDPNEGPCGPNPCPTINPNNQNP